jgi:hypothetical protein
MLSDEASQIIALVGEEREVIYLWNQNMINKY